jgi:hypothetical protein
MAREIFANDYFRLIADDRARLLWLVRTSAVFPSAASIERTFQDITEAVTAIPPEWSLLIDTREGPLRNDPEFESLLARARTSIVARFDRVAVLVKSAIGLLQVARYAREDKKSPRVFDDEEAAIASLIARPGRLSTKPPKA